MLMQRLYGNHGACGRVRFHGAFRRTTPVMDTTAYLLSSPANAERLLRAVEDVKAGRNMTRFDSVDALRAAAGLEREA